MLRFGSLALFLCFFLPSAVMAQEGSVTGRITDAATGEGLPGVNVVLVEIQRGAVSDARGQYNITGVPAGQYTLHATFIGYRHYRETLTVAREEVVLNIALQTDLLRLEDVVVTAHGVERVRQGLTFSVQEVTGARLVEAGAPNVMQGLQGKVAGLEIRQSSGMPGASMSMNIRGANSLTQSNQPLWVVDGIPVTSGALFGGGTAGADGPNRALDLNPEDIESITVLKGASATALYGVRAGNGAIVVTTRTGRRSAVSRVNVNFSSNVQFDEVSVVPDIQGMYAQGSGNVYNRVSSLSWGPRIAPGHTAQPITAPDGSVLGNTVPSLPSRILNALGEEIDAPTAPYDNISPFFRTGTTLTHNLDVRGSNPSGSYSFSLGHTTQSGIIPSTGMDRLTLRLAGEYELSRLFTTGGSVSYSKSDVDVLAKGSNLSNPLFTLYWAPRSFDLWGTPYHVPGNPAQQVNYRGAMDNPRWALANNEFTDGTDRMFGNAYLNFNPLDWLTLQYRLGTDIFSNRRREAHELGSGETGGRTVPPSGGRIEEYSIFNAQTTSNLTATVTRQLSPDINMSLLVGNDLNHVFGNTNHIFGTTMNIFGFKNVSNASTINGVETRGHQLNFGLFGDLQLDYRDMLYLNATARNDWHSTMPRSNPSFFYPSIGAAFVFTEALGWQQHPIFSYGKLKGSIAQVGQAAPAYATTQAFSRGNAFSGWIGDFTFPYAGRTAFTLQSTLANPNLEPQNNTMWEVGTELAFLDGRFGLEYNYFHENARNQIFSVPLPTPTGFWTQVRNAGELRNSGHELVLRAEPFRSRDFTWDLNVNFSAIESEVVSLTEGVENIILGGFVTPNVRAEVGLPYPIAFGSRYQRDNQGNIVHWNSPGNWWHGHPMMAEEEGSLGKVMPDWTAGITNTFRVRDFRLMAQLDVRQGGVMIAGNTRLQKLYGQDMLTADRETPWISPGVKGTRDAQGNLVIDGPNDIYILRGEAYWVNSMDAIWESNTYDTSFIRLREVTLSYVIPGRLLGRTPLAGAQIAFTGRNLLLITDYPNFDPETNLGGAGNFQGMEYVNLPGTRSYGLSLRLSL